MKKFDRLSFIEHLLFQALTLFSYSSLVMSMGLTHILAESVKKVFTIYPNIDFKLFALNIQWTVGSIDLWIVSDLWTHDLEKDKKRRLELIIREIIQNACYFLFSTVLSKIFYIKDVYI